MRGALLAPILSLPFPGEEGWIGDRRLVLHRIHPIGISCQYVSAAVCASKHMEPVTVTAGRRALEDETLRSHPLAADGGQGRKHGESAPPNERTPQKRKTLRNNLADVHATESRTPPRHSPSSDSPIKRLGAWYVLMRFGRGVVLVARRRFTAGILSGDPVVHHRRRCQSGV